MENNRNKTAPIFSPTQLQEFAKQGFIVDEYGTLSECTLPQNTEYIKIPYGIVQIGVDISPFNSTMYSKQFSDTPKGLIYTGWKRDFDDTCSNNNIFSHRKSLVNIEIPDSVTHINHRTFYRCTSLKTVELPNSITFIGDEIFFNCKSLISVKLSDNIKMITAEMFCGCSSLIEIDIPNGVTDIEFIAFKDCVSLAKINLPDTLLFIESNAFSNCKSLTEIKIPYGVDTISIDLFSGCTSLLKVELPETIKYIESSAFRDCSALSSIRLPSKVTHIGDFAFAWCKSLEEVEILGEIELIYEDAFVDTPWLNSIIDENGFAVYKNMLLKYNGKNPHVVVPYGIEIVVDGAFRNLDFITKVTFTDTLIYIGFNVFSNCSSLVDIENMPLYLQVEAIKKDSFQNTQWLNSAVDKNGFLILDSILFQYNGNDANVVIPYGVKEIYRNVFRYCEFLDSVSIPDSLKSVGKGAFFGCSNLVNVDMPNCVDIEDSAFLKTPWYESLCDENGFIIYKNTLISYNYICENKSVVVNIPYGITHINKSAFFLYDNIENVVIPNTVVCIGCNAFEDCVSFRDIVVPNSVNVISEDAFKGCKPVSVTVPNAFESQLSSIFDCDLSGVSVAFI